MSPSALSCFARSRAQRDRGKLQITEIRFRSASFMVLLFRSHEDIEFDAEKGRRDEFVEGRFRKQDLEQETRVCGLIS